MRLGVGDQALTPRDDRRLQVRDLRPDSGNDGRSQDGEHDPAARLYEERQQRDSIPTSDDGRHQERPEPRTQ